MFKLFKGVFLSVIALNAVMAGRPGEGDEIQRPRSASLSASMTALRNQASSALGGVSSTLRVRSDGDGDWNRSRQIDDLVRSLESLNLSVDQPFGARLNTSLDGDVASAELRPGNAQAVDSMQEDQAVTAYARPAQRQSDDDDNASEGMPVFLTDGPQVGDEDPADSRQVRGGSNDDDGSYDHNIGSPANLPTSEDSSIDLSRLVLGVDGEVYDIDDLRPGPLMQTVLQLTATGGLTFGLPATSSSVGAEAATSRPLLQNPPRNTGRRNRDAYEDHAASDDESDDDHTVNDDDDNDENIPPQNVQKRARRWEPAQTFPAVLSQ